MSAPRRWSKPVGALLLASLGFMAGAGGSAWWARLRRAEPWRAMRVEHEGGDNSATRTRLIFEDATVPLTLVEVRRDPEGAPEQAIVASAEGAQIIVRFDDERRPSSLEGPDGARATLRYAGKQTTITFARADGTELAERTVRVPPELRATLRLAENDVPRGVGWRALLVALIGEAHAAEDEAPEDEAVSVEREVTVRLSVKVPREEGAGPARVEAACPPFTCVPVAAEIETPAQTDLRITVAGSAPKAGLAAPKNDDLAPFRDEARLERSIAQRVLPHARAVVAALGVTAIACSRAGLSLSLCIGGLRTRASGAVDAIAAHRVETSGRSVEARAAALFHEDRARAAIDRAARLEICLSRDGFARVCTTADARPFATTPMPRLARSLTLEPGIGGVLLGSFEMTQSDGPDCRFSPSPRTSGALQMSFDNEKGVVTATLQATESGTRPNLRCSMGTTSMRWSQSYSATLTQSFRREALRSGGKLDLRLSGTMGGSGSYGFTVCRTSGGTPANCPAGKREAYSYPLELVGELDLRTQRGSGTLLVRGAPLSTRGTWRLPAEKNP